LLSAEQANAQRQAAADIANGQVAANYAKAGADASRAWYQNDLERHGIDEKIRDINRSMIDAQVAAGNKALEVERDRLRIQDEFASKAKEIAQAMLTASDAQKAALQAQLNALPGMERMAQNQRINTGIRDQYESALQAAAGAGFRPAEAELKRFQARKTLFDQYGQLSGIFHDPNATAAQKAQAQATYQADRMQENLAEMLAGRQGVTFKATADTEYYHGGSGLAQHAREQAFLRQGADQGKVLSNILALLKTFHIPEPAQLLN
jgi:hypothetical protein